MLPDQLFADYLLPVVLSLIVLGMGLTLTLQDFRNIVLYPRTLILGLTCQMLLVPGVAFLLASISGLSPVYQMGLVLIAICPGGATSNLITHLMRGNVALSISLTAVNSLLILVSIPLLLKLGFITFMQEAKDVSLSVPDTVLDVFLIVVLPVIVGMVIRRYQPRFAKIADKVLDYGMPVLLALAYLGVVFLDEGEHETDLRGPLGLVLLFTFLLNLLAVWLGYFLALRLSKNNGNALTIAIEVGLQNSSLALVLAFSQLSSPRMAEVAIVYAGFSFFTTAGYAWVMRHLYRWKPAWYQGIAEYAKNRQRKTQVQDKTAQN